MTQKTILITGCSSGIGLALARECRRRGCRVLATARRADSVQALEAEGFEALPLDITKDESVAALAATLSERGDSVDMLINNAGHSLFGPMAEVPLAEVSRLFETNVVSQIRVCQGLIPVMVKQGGGHIVNVGSVMGLMTTPYVGAYSASKAALHLLSDALRMELAPFGIGVTVLQPGAVASEVAAHADEHSGLDRYDHPDSLYHPAARFIRARAKASQDKPMAADDFARQVLDKLLRRPPPRTLIAGGGRGLLTMLSCLPGPVRDRIFSARFPFVAVDRERR